jgi:hypothetical protein
VLVLIEDGRVEVRFRLPALEPADDGEDIIYGGRIEFRELGVYMGELSQSKE